ncbi:MAG TPA: cytochrome c oxidase accessory protein CcoG [Hellea balneolensis]|uniref:Cytochrome c oxidase accessory protein CcoG n=1 Tax=Hellea balneolensis TaxID=287478 RepID=A0A7C5M4J9_9PROT|nr:cytochrome c oxidase accessory protein CcoG [Hellea balneolensis]
MSENETQKQQRAQAAPGIQKSRWTVSTKTVPLKNTGLYKKRVKVFPKRVKGKFRTLKWIALFVLLGIYYFIPFVRWDRGPGLPNQAVLVDFENARFYFFFIEIWPQEIYYITGLLILAALGLFLASALFGRLWCGFACPQTIWTDLFIAVERFFEGDRNARLKLERQKWNLNKIAKKTGKHIVWLLIAMLTGGAWILYFHDAFDVVSHFFTGGAPMTAYVFVAILTFTTYTLAGFMREQICIYMCPWPRIQAAMTDEDTLNVTYRRDRGEPRGPHKKGDTWEGRGDCIDCRQCIAVCPTGIDIRDGLQLECIGCSLCIDACDAIMEKVGRPKGLIGYDTDLNNEARLKGEKPKYRLIRARTIAYALIFTAVASVMLFGLTHRSVLNMNVLRDRIPNYVRLQDGSVRNGYTIKILNKEPDDRAYKLSVEGLDHPKISVVGEKPQNGTFILSAPGDSVRDYKVYLAVEDAKTLPPSVDITFHLVDIKDGKDTLTPSTFVTGN